MRSDRAHLGETRRDGRPVRPVLEDHSLGLRLAHCRRVDGVLVVGGVRAGVAVAALGVCLWVRVEVVAWSLRLTARVWEEGGRARPVRRRRACVGAS